MGSLRLSNKNKHFCILFIFKYFRITFYTQNYNRLNQQSSYLTAKLFPEFFLIIDGGGDTQFIFIEMSSSFGFSILLNRTRPLSPQMIHHFKFLFNLLAASLADRLLTSPFSFCFTRGFPYSKAT